MIISKFNSTKQQPFNYAHHFVGWLLRKNSAEEVVENAKNIDRLKSTIC